MSATACEPAPSAARRATDAAAVLLCALLTVPYLSHEMLDGDEAIFAGVATRMQAYGLPVYQAGWDNKPPGVFLVHRLAVAAFSRESLLGAHIAMALVWVLTAVVVGRAARRLLGADAFAPAVLAYALLRSWGTQKAGAANTEAFLQLPLALGLSALLGDTAGTKRAPFVGGAWLAVAALFKPLVALYGISAAVAVALVRGPRAALRSAVFGASGAAAVGGATIAWLAASGDLAAAKLCNYDVMRAYVDHSPPHDAAAVASGLWREIAAVPAPWLLVAALAVIAVRLPELPGTRGPLRRWFIAGLVVVAAGVATVSVGGYFRRHYWLAVHPPLAVLCAAAWVALWRGATGTAWRWVGRVAAVGIVLVAWLPAQRMDKRRLLQELKANPYLAPEVRGAGEAIRRHSGPDDPVFVWGISPELYLLSGRIPATRFVSCIFLNGALRWDVLNGDAPPTGDVVPAAWPALFEDLERYPPAVFVDTSRSGRYGWNRSPLASFPGLEAYVRDRFRLAEQSGGYDIYVRRSP